MPKPLTLYITGPAEADLKEIKKHTIKNWSEAQYARYSSKLHSSLKALTILPEIGVERKVLGAGRRVLASGQHLIVYRVVKDQVRIARIIHGGRDLKRTLDRSRDKGRGRGR